MVSVFAAPGKSSIHLRKNKGNAVNATFPLLFANAADRNRTGTKFNPRRILSPVRLPVPPLRLAFAKLLSAWMEKDSNRFGFEPKRFVPFSQWMEKDSNLRRRCQQIYSLPLWPLGNPSISLSERRIRSDKIFYTTFLHEMQGLLSDHRHSFR